LYVNLSSKISYCRYEKYNKTFEFCLKILQFKGQIIKAESYGFKFKLECLTLRTKLSAGTLRIKPEC
jgi:hypothetical protein